MKRGDGEVNTHRSRVALVCCLVIATLATSCGGRERKAERLYRQAQERVERGDTQAAVALMQDLIDRYPDAQIAAKARDQIILYRGLAHAVESYPARRAREAMVQIARAIESYRSASGRWPSSLEDLVPSKLPSIPADPWGRAFDYAVLGRGYRLRCLGSDGSAGGEADAADVLVVNGEFTTAAP
jgi:hypothetical protein